MKYKIALLFSVLTLSLTAFAAEGDEELASNPTLADLVLDDENLIAAVDNLGPNAGGFTSEGDFGPDDEDSVDPKVLRDFIESKGLIECRQKSGRLTIAGDVRARWIATGEKVNGEKQRGTHTNTAINLFRSEVNLFFDYTAPRSWVTTKLKWVNYDGKDGGTSTRVEMERGFIGYDIYHQGKTDFYIEVGRSKLDYMFDSKVEFTALFDGIHLYYETEFCGLGPFVIHGGPFIIDSYTNHYAWVLETGFTNFFETGLGFKYSIIDWRRFAPTLNYGNLPNSGNVFIQDNPRYRFLVSQMLIGYQRKIDFLGCKTLYIYGAVLANHDATPTRTTNFKHLNHAWYVGFTLGKLCKACDWSLDINYQSVQALAVPEFDLCGFGHGNAADLLLSDAIIQGFGPFDGVGFTNYVGPQISLLYALTDTLSLRAKAEWSRPRNREIGGDFRYKCFDMSVIYAF